MTPLKPLGAPALALGLTAAAAAAPLSITVDGIEARGGKLCIGVQTEAQLMKDDGVAGQIFEAPSAGSKTVSFDLPEGGYSVSVWHVFNGNGVFDTDEAGAPVDGWSSLNAAELTAAPTFEQASLPVTGDGGAITLDRVYQD